MDVEGAEPRVWSGMQAIVHRHRPTIVFEFSPILLNRTSEVDPAAFLKEIQDLYDLFIILPAGNTAAAAGQHSGDHKSPRRVRPFYTPGGQAA